MLLPWSIKCVMKDEVRHLITIGVNNLVKNKHIAVVIFTLLSSGWIRNGSYTLQSSFWHHAESNMLTNSVINWNTHSISIIVPKLSQLGYFIYSTLHKSILDELGSSLSVSCTLRFFALCTCKQIVLRHRNYLMRSSNHHDIIIIWNNVQHSYVNPCSCKIYFTPPLHPY